MSTSRTVSVLVALTLVCGLTAAVANAGGPGCGGHSKDEKTAKTCGASKASCCAGEFPTIVMKVGEKSYQCPVEAKKAMEADGGKMTYWVCDKSYHDQSKATVALASASEKYVEDYTRVGCLVDGKVVYKADEAGGKNCTGKGQGEKPAAHGQTCGHAHGEKAAEDKGDSTGPHKFVVLGREFNTWDEAAKARDQAMSAVKQVKMTYVVDGKEVDDCAKVCPKAKAAGKVQFVVGETKTSCEDTARYTLAKAQYEAAKGVGEKLAKL